MFAMLPNSLLCLLAILGFSNALPQDPTITPAPVLARQDACQVVRTVVKQGDHLSAIAPALGVGICNIARTNNIVNINSIYHGQTLSVAARGCESILNPPCSIPGAAARTHIAVQGDTFWSLALQQGISVQSLQAANPGLPANNIPLGHSVIIPARG